FATYRPNREIAVPGSQAAAVGQSYGAWINKFIDNVQGYQKVLIWGINYGIGESPTGAFWGAAYPMIVTHLQQYPYTNYSNPPGRALVEVGLPFNGFSSSVLPQLYGYRWDWQTSQQEAYNWQQVQSDPPD